MEWTEDLSVGIDIIDEQHKELFKRINGLVEAIRSSTCKYSIPEVIRFLEDYIVTHFSEEERYMMRYDYPDFQQHRAQHGIFMNNFIELKKELEILEGGKKRGSYDLSVTTNQVVVDWILDHISKIDKKLGIFLKDKL
jgi:hemerythrin-like metal-binding protein